MTSTDSDIKVNNEQQSDLQVENTGKITFDSKGNVAKSQLGNFKHFKEEEEKN